MSASVVSGMDAAPVFETGEHVLDPVALPVEDRIVAVLDAMAGVGRYTRRDAPLFQRLAEACGTVGSIGQQEVSGGQLFDHRRSGLVVVGLSLAQMQQQRSSFTVADHLQLGG